MIFFDLAILDLLLLFDTLRRQTIIMFLALINQALQVTQSNTTSLYENSMYELSFDCRRVAFEYYLNDLFDPTLRRIFIRDIENSQAIIIYNANEQNEPTYIYNQSEASDPVYVYNTEELLDLLDFEVVLPLVFFWNNDLLIQKIEIFKLPGMAYTIIQE